jgi:tRNA pseudouridine55 synthase
MDGIILIDKPAGITSHQVIDIVRKKLGMRRVGHAGTLDPLATGLLIIMLGNSTKLSDYLMSDFKSYEAEMRLFIKTDSDDLTGKITEERDFQEFTKQQIFDAIDFFNGKKYFQVPPIYSAIKYKGKKLYEYARKGIEIDIKPREVFIRSMELKEYDPKKGTISFKADCSKGTYIRSLSSNISSLLGTISTITKIRRIRSGDFRIDKSLKLDEFLLKEIHEIEEKAAEMGK